jgi:hypothetical protein
MAAFAMSKKRQSGAFYQRVLRFSSNPLADITGRISTIVYVSAVAGAILLTLTLNLAMHQMFDVITFILRNLHKIIFIGPWQTEVIPAR